jgi:hypothetical protein
MKGITKIMMLSCKQAAELSSKKSFDNLTIKESIKFKLHASMCKACKSFHKQNEMLDQAITTALSKKDSEKFQLSDNQKIRIKDTLKK